MASMFLYPHTLVKVDLLLFSGGRDANSDGLDLDVVNVEVSSWLKGSYIGQPLLVTYWSPNYCQIY